MKQWIIQGGRPLHGRVTVSGAKNVAFKLMIAALLGQEPTTLENVPDVGDVELAAKMIQSLGGKVERIDRQTIGIDPRSATGCTVPSELAKQSRASLMFVGPLLVRCHRAELPLPGGDRIGRRPLDRHVEGLTKLGADIIQREGVIYAKSRSLKGTHYRFAKNTHTGTETLLLAAVMAEGQTMLENAAEEPEVDDLIALLNGMGARIHRSDPRTIVIEGVESLQGATHRIISDRNEIVSFACMALATKGDLWIDGVQPEYVQAFLDQLRPIGAGFEIEGSSLHVWYQDKLRPAEITTAPHPGFMSDWQPLMTTLLTQAEGISTVHETVFERRFGYVKDLRRMGARIDFFNPPVDHPEEFYNFNRQDDAPENQHAIRIHGPTLLQGIETTVPDVRAGATLVQAALTAQGQTTLSEVEHIERGYEGLDRRLRELGADIRVVSDDD